MTLNVVEDLSTVPQNEYPPIIYKYRDWTNSHHKSLLTESVLYLSSPRNFSKDDPYDCNVPEKFPEGEDLRRFYAEKYNPTNSDGMTLKQFVDYWCQHSPMANQQVRDNLLNEIMEDFFDKFGVLSMTTDCANDTMWEKYGNRHQGFCVGFKTSELLPLIGGVSPVLYYDELPVIDFWKDSFETQHIKRIYSKERKWEFEKEYRVHKMWQQSATTEQRQIHFPTESLIEIYLGKNMPESHRNEIKCIAAKKYPNASIVEL